MVYIVLLIVVVLVLGQPTVKGKIGEAIVKAAIAIGNAGEKQNKQLVIHNLVLEPEPGKTSQIDHVVINRNGVFVIETKNYSGRIYGDDFSRDWTQVLNYGKTKNRFYSPVKQNFTHQCVIQALLSDDTPIVPIVVFTDGDISHVRSKYVCTVRGMLQRLKTAGERQLTDEEIETIHAVLSGQNKSETICNAEHIHNIEERKKAVEHTIEQRICPRCGGKLIERHGRRGTFLGCSNYPSCRFTEKID